MEGEIQNIKNKIIEYGFKSVLSAALPIGYTLLMGSNQDSYAWSALSLMCSEIIYKEYRRQKMDLERICQ